MGVRICSTYNEFTTQRNNNRWSVEVEGPLPFMESVRSKRTNSPRGTLEIHDASHCAIEAFASFAISSAGQSIIRSILLANMPNNLEDKVQTTLFHLIGQLKSKYYRCDDVLSFRPPRFSLLRSHDQNGILRTRLPKGIDAVTLFRDNQAPQILILEEVGFRKALLLCQETYSDVITHYVASILHVDLQGDVSIQLLESMRQGKMVAPCKTRIPTPVQILFEGRSYLACPR